MILSWHFSCLVRSVRFLAFAVRTALRFKLVALACAVSSQDSAEKALARFYARCAMGCIATAMELQGFYLLALQWFSEVGAALVSVDLAREFELVRDVRWLPMPFEDVRTVVEAEFGSFRRVFSSFDKEPLRSGLSSQHHSATLRDGHAVVVKVLRPGAESSCRVDVKVCRIFVTVFFPGYLGVLQELESICSQKFDLVRQAILQREAVQELQELQDVDAVVVPAPIDARHPQSPRSQGLCSAAVLVMDRVEGITLAEWSSSACRRCASRRKHRATVDEVRFELLTSPEKFSEPLEQFLALGGSPVARGHFRRLAQELMKVQAQMLFGAGFVNGCPSLGNLMLLWDGRLALLDWGQATQLSGDEQCMLAGLFMAVDGRAGLMAADCTRLLGLQTKLNWDYTFSMAARLLLCSWADLVADGCRDAVGLLEAAAGADAVTRPVRGTYAASVRHFVTLRRAAASLGSPDLSLAVAFRSAAEECLRSAGWPLPLATPFTIPVPGEAQRLAASGAASFRWSSVYACDLCLELLLLSGAPCTAPGHPRGAGGAGAAAGRGLAATAVFVGVASYGAVLLARDYDPGRRALIALSPTWGAVIGLHMASSLRHYTRCQLPEAPSGDPGALSRQVDLNRRELSFASLRPASMDAAVSIRLPISACVLTAGTIFSLGLVENVGGREGPLVGVVVLVGLVNAWLVLDMAFRVSTCADSTPKLVQAAAHAHGVLIVAAYCSVLITIGAALPLRGSWPRSIQFPELDAWTWRTAIAGGGLQSR